MPYSDVELFDNAAVNKVNLLNSNKAKYMLRAIVAGMFIGVAMIFSNVAGNVFSSSDPAWAKLIAAIVFSTAVLLIIFIGGELFTGNNFIMAFGAFDKKVSIKDVLRVWLYSYIGNFIGCVLFAALFVAAGASGTHQYFANIISVKLDIPFVQLLVRAILCNFFVCLAVVCGIKCKGDSLKFMMIVFCITAFVISGFEHCIANMATFSTCFFMDPSVSLLKMLRSMIVVTIGNIAGGGVLLAWPLCRMSNHK